MVTYRYYVSPPHYWSTTGGSPPLAAMTARSLLGILRAKVLHRSLVTSGPVHCTKLSLNLLYDPLHHRDLRPLYYYHDMPQILLLLGPSPLLNHPEPEVKKLKNHLDFFKIMVC